MTTRSPTTRRAGDGDADGSDRIGLRRRLRYRFDNLLARGTWATLAWLGVVTVFTVVVSSMLLWVFGVTFAETGDGSWLEDLWQSLLRILDTGTMAGDIGWGPRLLALLVTVFGLLVAGTLIGIMAAGVEDRIDQMRRGRSVVIETDHVVVLGRSDRLPVLVDQLVRAGRRRADNVVVVLADDDPADIDSEVREVVRDRRGSRIVFRSGDPTQPADLELCRLDAARSIIVLDDPARDDLDTVRVVLAVLARFGTDDPPPIVVEARTPELAERLVHACGPVVHPLVTTQAVARTAAFALQAPGLAHLADELLDFRGSDVHVLAVDDLQGRRFAEVIGRFAKARPLGALGPDGTVHLNPPSEFVFRPGDRLVVLADDVGVPDPARLPVTLPSPLPSADEVAGRDASLLVVGWHDGAPELLTQWVRTASPSATVSIEVDPDLVDPAQVRRLVPEPARMRVVARRQLDTPLQHEPGQEPPTTILVLGYRGALTTAAADTRTLLALQAFQRTRTHDDRRPAPRLVVELLDARDESLVTLTGRDDVLVSPAIGSQYLAQLAELPERRPIILAMTAPEGPSLRVVQASALGLSGTVGVPQMVAAAYATGALAIGWRQRDPRHPALVLNPHEEETITISAGDEVIVLTAADRPAPEETDGPPLTHSG